MSKTNKKLLKEQHLNTILTESYKRENKEVDGSPVIASFKINVTTENLENHNGRIYPSAVWDQHYSFKKGGKYLDESGKLRPLSLLGNLDHPKDDDGDVYLSEAGLTWASLERDGDDWNGTAHVLDTPQGRIIKTFLEYAKQYGGGDQIGVSTRALGDARLVESASGTVEEIIPEDFELVSIDFVYNPSSLRANTPLMESKKRGTTLVESIQKLKAADKEDHKEVYDSVLKNLVEENVEWAHVSYVTEDEAKLRNLCTQNNVKLGPETLDRDGTYRVRIEGKFDDVHKVKHIWGNYLFNGVLEEVTKDFDVNKVLEEAASIAKAKEEYLKNLKDTAHTLHNAIYALDNMTDDEYKQTKYYIDTPSKAKFLTKLQKEHDEVLSELKVQEGLVESTLNSSVFIKDIYRDLASILDVLYNMDYKEYNAEFGSTYKSKKAYELGMYQDILNNVEALENLVSPKDIELIKERLDKNEPVIDSVAYIIDLLERNYGYLAENKGDKMNKDEKEIIKENKDAKDEAEYSEDVKKEEAEDEEAESEDSEDVEDEVEEGTETEAEAEEESEEDTEETEEDKLDRILATMEDILVKLDDLFAPIEPLEDLEEEDVEADEEADFTDEETDFTDEDIDSMTEEELLSLEEFLELE